MVKEEKIEEVKALIKLIEKHPVIGVVEMYKMPSTQLQQIRKQLRGKAVIKMVKKSILKFAIERIGKEGLKELEKNMPIQPAIILSDMDVFKLYALISKLKFPSYAKEGDIAPNDIRVSAGPTTLLPGPVISELQRVGIQAGVEGGKITIKKDATVVKAGEKISSNVASVLRKLNIKPMEIGLNIIALHNGELYDKDTLELVNSFPRMLAGAYNKALNLSVAIVYPTKENIKFLLLKAVNAMRAVESKINLGNALKDEKVGGEK